MKFLNLYRLLKKSILLLFGLILPTNANIIEISRLSDVVAHIQSNDSNEPAVCGFDIDFTLSRPTDPATDPANFQKYAKTFMMVLKEHKVNLEDVLFATAFTEQQTMEPDTLNIFNVISGVAKTVGLTARYSGQFVGVDFEEHTLRMLDQFGIKFNGSAESRVVFEDLPEHRENKPVFNKGIIFCNGERGAPVKKPQVFAEYMKSNKILTQRVVIIDDTRKHLEDFETFFAEKMSGINFVGLYYSKAMQDTPRDCTEDEFRAYLQRLITMLQPAINER